MVTTTSLVGFINEVGVPKWIAIDQDSVLSDDWLIQRQFSI